MWYCQRTSVVAEGLSGEARAEQSRVPQKNLSAVSVAYHSWKPSKKVVLAEMVGAQSDTEGNEIVQVGKL